MEDEDALMNRATTQNQPKTKTTMKQNMIAVSAIAKEFIANLCSEYPDQPGKTKSHDLTQREAVDAIVAFAEANRTQEKVETNDEGEDTLVEFDALDLEVRRTLALRAANVRANSAASKLEAKEKELEELKSQLARLMAAQGLVDEDDSE